MSPCLFRERRCNVKVAFYIVFTLFPSLHSAITRMTSVSFCTCVRFNVKETSGRESREGLVTSEQQDDTPASTLHTDYPTTKQHLPRHQQQLQHAPAATSQRLKNPVTCRVLMLDGIEYELNVEV